MKKIAVTDDLSFPVDVITQAIGVLAARGAGKSNSAAVLAERMFAAGLPFVVVDPVGSWFGLRSSRDGKGPGLSIPIFGGRHGDVPLERTAGPMLADMIAETRLSCVLDVCDFSEGEKIRFLTDFAERLYRKNQDPLHLFLEEADDYLPQRPFREQARCLRAFENIVRRGRARGLGITMISQRSAAINKMVLTQVGTLVVLRTTSPQDRKAIEAWLEYQGQSKEVLESLASLKDGEAWVWSPHWLGILKRVQFPLRETFDSGATPSDVKGRRPPTTLADVDLGAIRTRMAETIERAKAEDPRELRRQVADLGKKFSDLKAYADRLEHQAKAPKERSGKPFALPPGVLRRVEKTTERLTKVADRLASATGVLQGDAARLADSLVEAHRMPSTQPKPLTINREAFLRSENQPTARKRDRHVAGDAKLPIGEHRILTAIAQHSMGVTRDQLTVLTGYKRSSRDTYLQRLREREYVTIHGDVIEATMGGVEALGNGFEALPTGPALLTYWLQRLPEGERKILTVVVQAHPKAVDRERISEATGYARSSRDTYLQRLRSRKLVETEGRGSVRASGMLF